MKTENEELNGQRLEYLPPEFIENPEHNTKHPYTVEEDAERGDFEAMCLIAHMYVKGIGVKQDYQKAFKWYLGAAEAGITNAQYNLGVMYLN